MTEKPADPAKLSGPMVQPKSGKPEQIVVLLHGYGSDGNDLIALAQYFQAELPNALCVAPNAPHPCDINPAGYQWFPLDLDRDLSRLDGAASARPSIQTFLEDLWAETGLTAADTFLVGFSQGAMMALDVGLRLDPQPFGIVSFSGALIGPEHLQNELGGKPPVVLVHGSDDEVVPTESSQIADAHLRQWGILSAIHIDHGSGHAIAQDGLMFALAFVREVKAMRVAVAAPDAKN